jgi:hypothetical protein
VVTDVLYPSVLDELICTTCLCVSLLNYNDHVLNNPNIDNLAINNIPSNYYVVYYRIKKFTENETSYYYYYYNDNKNNFYSRELEEVKNKIKKWNEMALEYERKEMLKEKRKEKKFKNLI